MYNYNKYPGPSFARVGDKVVSENIELDLWKITRMLLIRRFLVNVFTTHAQI